MKKKKKTFPSFWSLLKIIEDTKKTKNKILLQSTQETAVLQKAPHLKLTKRKI